MISQILNQSKIQSWYFIISLPCEARWRRAIVIHVLVFNKTKKAKFGFLFDSQSDIIEEEKTKN